MTYKFWNGFQVEIKSAVPSHYHGLGDVIVRIDEDLRLKPDPTLMNHEVLVKSSELEDLVINTYVVGQKVRSTIGSFVGTVVSYEVPTNRVICVSEKISRYRDQRTRYAYKLSDIQPYHENTKGYVYFRPGYWYEVNGKELLAVESVFEPDEVMLFSKDGKIIHRDLPRLLDAGFMAHKYGLHTVIEKEKQHV